MQKTEPAEPLITVIYKPDSTLMGRENLPSPSFLCSPSSPRSSHASFLLTASLLLPSSFPFLPRCLRLSRLQHICCDVSLSNGSGLQRKSPVNKDKMYFSVSERQVNTPIGLSLGLAAVWEWPETKQQTKLPLRPAGTFLEIVFHAGSTARASEWERRPQISSQAPEGSQANNRAIMTPGSTHAPESTGAWAVVGGAGDGKERGGRSRERLWKELETGTGLALESELTGEFSLKAC